MVGLSWTWLYPVGPQTVDTYANTQAHTHAHTNARLATANNGLFFDMHAHTNTHTHVNTYTCTHTQARADIKINSEPFGSGKRFVYNAFLV